MSEIKTNLHLEIAHILFIDVVGYSKLSVNEQSELLHKLNEIVLATEQVRAADAANQLIRLPTGDGMALVFRNYPEAPAECALEIAAALKSYPEIQVRMGVHSGPVNEVTDVNQRANIAGAGVNMAQRVMDCGDAGHILLSKRVADDLAQYREWQPLLHDLGEVEVKHGVKVWVVNLYRDNLGNPGTPQKIERTRDEQRRVSRRRRSVSAGLFLFAALMLGTVVWFLAQRGKLQPARAVTALATKSIAVLPFQNLSASEENAFFADGVQDEILTNLAKVADLKVISRSSVMQFKAAAARNLRQVGQELGVAHILEGSVQRTGDQIRVNAQLIDARTDAHVWAQVYDRKVADLFALQSEMARTIADQLQAKLSPQERTAMDRPPTADLTAYALYLRARENLEDPEAKDSKEAEALLTDAVKRDPNFVLAHCELAAIYDSRYWNQVDRTPECRARADAAVETATRLAPEMGEVHLARGLHFYQGYRQYRWAQAEFALAQKALPNEPRVYAYLGYLARREGHWDEATKHLRRVCELDPASVNARWELADFYVLQARYAEARETSRSVPAVGKWGEAFGELLHEIDFWEKADISALRAITPEKLPDGSVPLQNVRLGLYDRDPDRAEKALAGVSPDEFPPAQPRPYWEGAIARLRGDRATMLRAFGEARVEVGKVIQSKPDDPELLAGLGVIDAMLGRKEEALREGRRALELLPLEHDAIRGMNLSIFLVWIYAWTGEEDQALAELERLVKIPNGPNYAQLRLYPLFEPLRGDPRFEAIVTSVAPKGTTSK